MAVSTAEAPAASSARWERAAAAAWVWRVRHTVVSGLFVAFALNTDPGKLVADTKLDLVLRPTALLSRGLHLWDPLGSAGQLQDQAYGYIFPMGPFFAVAHAMRVPGWVTQRLWWGLILVVSYVGFVALARRLRIGSEWTRVVAGVGFALAPHALSIMGRASIEAWPPALAPWVLVPLVGMGSQGRPRRAAALSGLAVLAMGGVNAAVDLAAILPAAIWLLTRRWSLEGLRLLLWWVLAMVAATFWWLVPLGALGRYSPPFLDYIESASITTSTTTLVEALRGTADWVPYLGELTSRAGFALLTQPLLILFTVLLAALGMAGIAWRRTPERAWLVLLLVLGASLVTMGHIGPVDGLFAPALRGLLDGVLAPLRNVHKFDILIRMALSLGVASALGALSGVERPRRPGSCAPSSRPRGRSSSSSGRRPRSSACGWPTPTPSARCRRTGPKRPTGWLAHDGDGRALFLVPGSRFPEYTWASTGDEPLQSLAGAPWDIRNAIPLSNAGHIRWLDSVERQVADGRGGRDLAQRLVDGGECAISSPATTSATARRERPGRSPSTPRSRRRRESRWSCRSGRSPVAAVPRTSSTIRASPSDCPLSRSTRWPLVPTCVPRSSRPPRSARWSAGRSRSAAPVWGTCPSPSWGRRRGSPARWWRAPRPDPGSLPTPRDGARRTSGIPDVRGVAGPGDRRPAAHLEAGSRRRRHRPAGRRGDGAARRGGLHHRLVVGVRRRLLPTVRPGCHALRRLRQEPAQPPWRPNPIKDPASKLLGRRRLRAVPRPRRRCGGPRRGPHLHRAAGADRPGRARRCRCATMWWPSRVSRPPTSPATTIAGIGGSPAQVQKAGIAEVTTRGSRSRAPSRSPTTPGPAVPTGWC